MARSRIRYSPNIAGVNRIMNGPEMVALLRKRAEAGMAFAESIAPRRTGAYSASFQVDTSTHAGPNHDRAEARLVNTSDHAVYVEHGGQGTPAYKVLARTVDVIERG